MPGPLDIDSRGRTRIRVIEDLFLRYGMLLALIAIVIAAQISFDRFLTVRNLQNLLTQNASIGIVAVGLTIVFISGGFDLSVGATFALGATAFATFALDGWPLPVAALFAVLLGSLCGLFNGLVITRLHVNAFVTTLGSAAVISGLALLWSDARPVRPNREGFGVLADRGPFSLTWAVWLLFAAFLVGGFVLSKTIYGRSIYAVGGNAEAARLAGLRVAWLRTSAFIVAGACATIGGIVLASRLGVGQADQGGPALTLDAIAVVIIGGTSLFGGEGAMWRTAVGLAILGSLNNLLSSLAITSASQDIIKGSVVIAAVALDSLSRRRSS